MKLISVAGPSGVGKSTVSLILQCLLEKSFTFCGDNYHKYPRNSPIWNTKTHLDPSCNDLDKAEYTITELLTRGDSFVQKYNHETGSFDDLDRVVIDQETTIIYEGLHSFYLKNIVPDLMIYVDTDDELTKEWKVQRDCVKRGYTREQVENTIKKRKPDENAYIKPQRNNADIIIKFEQSDSCIDISYVPITERGESDSVRILMSQFVHLYRCMMEFIKYSRLISSNTNLVQNSGGNLSYKVSDDLMIVKSSGSYMNDCNLFEGYSICRISNRIYNSEKEYEQELVNVSKYGKPSMEYGLHACLNHKIVLHVHALNLLTILCSSNSRKLLYDKFTKRFGGIVIEYVTPGYELSNRIFLENKTSGIYYLENHGLVVCGESLKEVSEIASDIEKYSAEVISEMCYNKPYFNHNMENGRLYPDHAIFPEKNADHARYILRNIVNSGLTPIYLSETEVSRLCAKPSEIYRKAVSI